MEKTIIKLDDIKVPPKKLHQHKRRISLKNLNIDKLAASNKVLFGKKGFKYFIGYEDAKKIRPLCIFLPKMSAHRKNFNETKYVSFLIKDNEIFKK